MRIKLKYTVKTLQEKHGSRLSLELIAGKTGLERLILVKEVQRPGISLSGYIKHHVSEQILVFGTQEVSYLQTLSGDLRKERIELIVSEKTPAVIVCSGSEVPLELVDGCEQTGTPLFITQKDAMEVLFNLSFSLSEDFAPETSVHGTLVEVSGMGLLIQGDSSIGKSEAALGLIERKHRLISDDVVKIRLLEGSFLEGYGPDLTRHMMEIRGIGIINIAHLYGAVCVRDRKKIDLVIQLESWDDSRFYGRAELDERYCEFLGVKLPCYVLPVKSGRDIVLLIETIVLQAHLKEMGYHSAKEFNGKLLEEIAKKQKRRCM